MLTPVPDFEWSRYTIQPLNIRTPLYFVATSPAQPTRTRGRQETAANEPEPARRLPAPRLELPRVPARKNAETVLLQPNVPMPNIQLSQMPAMAFWARQTPSLPAPAVKPFVTPGRTEESVSAAQLDAPPMLAVPNRQERLSDLNVAEMPAARDPRLPLPASATAPVRTPKTFQPPVARQAGSIDAGQGDAANIIALGALPAPDRIVTVPPVTQAPAFGSGDTPHLAPPPVRDGNSGGSASGTHGSASNTGARSAEAGKPGQGGAAADGSSTAPRATVEPRQAAIIRPGGDGDGGPATLTGGVVQQAILADARANANVPAPSPSSGVRVVQPKDGRFAFVAMGSSEAYPEARGLLGGKIVYTVSVRVGAPKPWVLQYCLPAAIERGLGLRASAVPLEAPYPYVMIRPPVASQIDVRRLVIHGVVTPAGRFEQISLISDVEFPEKQALLASLAQWEFRPASRDGQITAVEVLLIIPREAV